VEFGENGNFIMPARQRPLATSVKGESLSEAVAWHYAGSAPNQLRLGAGDSSEPIESERCVRRQLLLWGREI
jgi:hypothetical protein